MFRLLPQLRMPAILRSRPDEIDGSFLEQPTDRGHRNRIRTLAEKAGLAPDVTEALAEAHADVWRDARVEVSRPGQVPGLRRLILMGPLHGDRSLDVIGVTDEGLLFRRGLRTADGNDAPSPREALQLARLDPGRLCHVPGEADPGLTRHANPGTSYAGLVAGVIVNRTLSTLDSDQKQALPFPFLKGLEHVTRAKVARQAALVRHAVADSVDPGILRLARGCALYAMADLEWLCGGMVPQPGHPGRGRLFGVPIDSLNDRELSQARVQAVKAYPAMARAFTCREEFRGVVDRRETLSGAIASWLGVPEPGVRNINGLTWQRAGVPPSAPRDGLAQIARVPRALAPVSRSEHRQVQQISRFAQHLDIPMDEMMRKLARGGSPYRFEDEFRRISGSDVRDAVTHVVSSLLLPASLHRLRRLCEKRMSQGQFQESGVPVPAWNLQIEIERTLISDLSVRDMFDLSNRWHRNLQRHDDRLVTLTSRRTWPGFLGDVDLEGVRGRELTGTPALKAQGRRESHCVGGYSERILRSCRNGATLIFSLEKRDEIIGTVEIRLTPKPEGEGGDANAWGARVVQNRGKNNAPVSSAAETAAEMLCRRIEEAAPARMDEYLAGISRSRKANAAWSRLSDHVRNAGYDIWDPERLQIAWDELSVYLPRAMRKAGLAGLLAERPEDETLLGAPGSETPFWEHDRHAILALDDPSIEVPPMRMEPWNRNMFARAWVEEDPQWMPF